MPSSRPTVPTSFFVFTLIAALMTVPVLGLLPLAVCLVALVCLARAFR